MASLVASSSSSSLRAVSTAAVAPAPHRDLFLRHHFAAITALVHTHSSLAMDVARVVVDYVTSREGDCFGAEQWNGCYRLGYQRRFGSRREAVIVDPALVPALDPFKFYA